jgi:hypothetical protein
MPVQFQNYEFSYLRSGKPIFAPSDLGKRIGEDIKNQVEAAYSFDDFVFHLRHSGGHVAALHAHRDHKYFARVDIARFFYSIARNRVQRALAEIGILRARHYAKWSCVKNPYLDPTYALPYGFIQSPILSSLVLMQSAVGNYLRSISTGGQISVSVYMDDISLSSDNNDVLVEAFEKLKQNLGEANFGLNIAKERTPSSAMDVFNCDISRGKVGVQQQRVDLFYSQERSPLSIAGFEDYCERVIDGNAP